MKDSEYFESQAAMHQAAADNPAFEGWVRAANRASATRCRGSAIEAREIELAEAIVAAAQEATEDENAPGNPWDDLEAAELHLDALIRAQEARDA